MGLVNPICFTSFRSWITFLVSSIKPRFASVLGLWWHFPLCGFALGSFIPYAKVKDSFVYILSVILFCFLADITILISVLNQPYLPVTSTDGRWTGKAEGLWLLKTMTFNRLLTVSEACWGSFPQICHVGAALLPHWVRMTVQSLGLSVSL